MPAAPAAGVPDSVAVPSPASVNVTPLGRVPVALSVTVPGPPSVVTVNVPALPTLNVVVAGLVKRSPTESPLEPTEIPSPIPGGGKKLASSLRSTPLRIRTG